MMEKHYLEKYDKSSQALINIVGIYAEKVESLDQFTLLAMMGQFSWNVSLLALGQQKKFIRDFARKFPPGNRDTIRSMLLFFIDRKKALYPEDGRFMIDISISERKSTYYLKVFTLFPENAANAIEELKKNGKFLNIPLDDFLIK